MKQIVFKLPGRCGVRRFLSRPEVRREVMLYVTATPLPSELAPAKRSPAPRAGALS